MSDARLTSLGEGKGPIVLQGAMEMEVAPFIKRLKGAELEVYGDFFFWRGTFGTRPLIISQTGIGTAAAGKDRIGRGWCSNGSCLRSLSALPYREPRYGRRLRRPCCR